MDKSNIVVISVKALEIPRIEVVTSDRKKRTVNLKKFSSVYCFPKSQKEWEKVSVGEHGMNVSWDGGFEIHADQAIDWSELEEDIKLQA